MTVNRMGTMLAKTNDADSFKEFLAAIAPILELTQTEVYLIHEQVGYAEERKIINREEMNVLQKPLKSWPEQPLTAKFMFFLLSRRINFYGKAHR